MDSQAESAAQLVCLSCAHTACSQRSTKLIGAYGITGHMNGLICSLTMQLYALRVFLHCLMPEQTLSSFSCADLEQVPYFKAGCPQ